MSTSLALGGVHLREDPADQLHNFRLLLHVDQALALENLGCLLMSVRCSLSYDVVSLAARLGVSRIFNLLRGRLPWRLLSLALGACYSIVAVVVIVVHALQVLCEHRCQPLGSLL